MKRASWIIRRSVFLLLWTAVTARAALVNPGFETGDLAGWSFTSPYVSVVTSANGRGNQLGTQWLPAEGSYFAYLKAGLGADVYTTLAQNLRLAAGDIVAFDVFFDTRDWMPHNDDGYARLVDLTTGAATTLYAQSVATVGDFDADGWTRVSYTVPTAGDYRLEFGVRNIGDNLFYSALGVDGITAPLAIPAPGALIPVGVGACLCGWLRRRRKL